MYWILACGKSPISDGKELIHVYVFCNSFWVDDASPVAIKLLRDGKEIVSSGKQVYPEVKKDFYHLHPSPIKTLESKDIISSGGYFASVTFEVLVCDNVDGVKCVLANGKEKFMSI